MRTPPALAGTEDGEVVWVLSRKLGKKAQSFQALQWLRHLESQRPWWEVEVLQQVLQGTKAPPSPAAEPRPPSHTRTQFEFLTGRHQVVLSCPRCGRRVSLTARQVRRWAVKHRGEITA